jgi:hypothetical protein
MRADLIDIDGYEYPQAIGCPEITLPEIKLRGASTEYREEFGRPSRGWPVPCLEHELY